MDKKKPEDTPAAAQPAAPGGQRSGKYVPPSLREGGNRKGESMALKTRGNVSCPIK
jgi:translation initiation factor 3 subunit G